MVAIGGSWNLRGKQRPGVPAAPHQLCKDGKCHLRARHGRNQREEQSGKQECRYTSYMKRLLDFV